MYDLDSGEEREVYKGHHGPALCASYSPDGEVYASGSEDGESLSLLTSAGTGSVVRIRTDLSRHNQVVADQSWEIVRSLADSGVGI